MMKPSLLLALIFLAPSLAIGHEFMPDNDLHLDPPPLTGGIDEEEFNIVIDKAEAAYNKVFDAFGAKLIIHRLWNDNTVNAQAFQNGMNWNVNMFGGLARRVSSDAFALVVCHEVGHHLGGAIFSGPQDWAASEGQSDYFATISCARKLWLNDREINGRAKAELLLLQGGSAMKKNCDESWSNIKERQLCYRTVVAGKGLGDLLSRSRLPELDTPDTSKVQRTSTAHPAAQCRLDTYVAGALCNTSWTDTLIPGKDVKDRTGLKAMIEAKPYACHSYKDKLGFRPHCWFNPDDLSSPIISSSELIEDIELSEDERKNMESLQVISGEKVNISVYGNSAHLYLRFDVTPTLDEYDCRARSIFGKRCRLAVPQGAEELNIMLHGRRYGGEVDLKINRESESKLCRNYEDGNGSPFPCYDGMSCKVIPGGQADNPGDWCVDY